MDLSKAHSSTGGGVISGGSASGSGSGSGFIGGSGGASGGGAGHGYGESNIVQVRPQRINLKLRARKFQSILFFFC